MSVTRGLLLLVAGIVISSAACAALVSSREALFQLTSRSVNG